MISPQMVLRRCGLLWLALVIFCGVAQAAVPRDFVIDLEATVSATAPHIRLTWGQRIQSNITGQKIFRRLKGQTAWVEQATLVVTDTSYTDNTAQPGVEYEYYLQRTLSGLTPNVAMGYLSSAVDLPPVEARGKLLLVVDSTMVAPLAPEIAQLQQDLTGDGWIVQTISVARTDTGAAVKAQIKTIYDADPVNVKAVYLLGHVPVPYSGQLAPDGHGDHVGAWPADGYYGEMNGTWTDTTVNNTSASSARNDNIPGDGKFDQSTLPGEVELQVGRVDMSGMTKAPTSAISETDLLRRVLRKAHQYRHRLGAYASIPRRSMIRDGFGHAFSSEPFASSGWAAAFTVVGKTVDTPGSDQWFNQATSNSYLWGYGTGGGSYESASSVGTSADFGSKPSRVVFTGLFGSYHGDWDAGNNFMRAVLAGNAHGNSLGLACFWAGRPHWYLHPCGMGETLGYATRMNMNLTGLSSGYLPGGSSARGVHVGLMGDPSLRFHMVEPPRALGIASANGEVHLKWQASTEAALLGYHVYRSDLPSGPFTRLTTTPIATAAYTDSTASAGQTYTYMVRTLKTETAPGGPYQNLSQGSFATMTVSSSPAGAPFSPNALTAQTLSASNTQLAWVDNSTNETGFQIERKTNATGTFTTVGTVGQNVTSFTDPGPLTHGNVYFYRVLAIGAVGNSTPSEEVSVDGFAGFLDLTTASRFKVPKTVGTVNVSVTRFGGTTGAVSATLATTAAGALAGTHFIPLNTTASFPDGDTAAKAFTLNVLNTSQPQLPRQFRVAVSSPTGSANLGTQATTRVLIEDSSATLPAPWQQATVGSITDSSPSVFAEGAIGGAVSGGSLSTTSDNGRYVFQQRTGDGVMTTYVDTPLNTLSSARFALMIRGSNTNNVPMATVFVAASSTGTRLATRATTGGAHTLLPAANNNLQAARWIRITRSGDSFTGETSTDGANWTTLGTATITIPPAANWGLFHAGDSSGDFQTPRFRHTTITNIGETATPVNFTATSGAPTRVNLAWDPAGGAGSYQIERRALHGTFAPLQTVSAPAVSFADSSVLPGVIYQYRLRATSAGVDSDWTAVAQATAPGSASGYQQWLQANSLPMDGSGPGAPGTVLADDGIRNAMKAALGLPPRVPGYGGRIVEEIIEQNGNSHLAITYTRPEPAPTGISYHVESGDAPNILSDANTTVAGVTGTGNIRTITIRDNAPIAPPSGPSQRFIRLRVNVP